jgi:hypothetical protein
MSIRKEDRAHGAAILKLLEEASENYPSISYRIHTGESRSCYLLEIEAVTIASPLKIGLFLKTSNKRISPWRYSFSLLHQQEIEDLYHVCDAVFLILLAGEDGYGWID